MPTWTILLQLLIPVLLLLWLGLRPAPSRLGFGLQVLGTGLALFALARVGLWALPPWWTPWLLGGIWAALVGRRLVLRTRVAPEAPVHLFPRGAAGWAGVVVALALALLGGAAVGATMRARTLPPVQVVDIPNPMGPGRYLVAHGGFRALTNGHLMTLDTSVPRFADWRGQSYAVDLMGIDALGFRTRGLRPEDPARYAIFGVPVHAPCGGRVLATEECLAAEKCRLPGSFGPASTCLGGITSFPSQWRRRGLLLLGASFRRGGGGGPPGAVGKLAPSGRGWVNSETLPSPTSHHMASGPAPPGAPIFKGSPPGADESDGGILGCGDRDPGGR